MVLAVVRGGWAAYSRAMGRHPLATSMATSGVVMGAGDALAQRLDRRARPDGTGVAFDAKRNLITSSWNALFFAPTFFFWFRALDRRVPGSTFRAAAAKVLINMVVIVVPINAGFVAYTLALEHALGARSAVGQARGGDYNQVPLGERIRGAVEHKLRNEFVDIFKASALVWVPANMLNFMFVPPTFRVLPTVFTSLLWNTILSRITHRPLPPAAASGPAGLEASS